MPAASKTPDRRHLTGSWHAMATGSAECRGNSDGDVRFTMSDKRRGTHGIAVEFPILLKAAAAKRPPQLTYLLLRSHRVRCAENEGLDLLHFSGGQLAGEVRHAA